LRAEISILQSSKGEFRNLCCEWFEGVLEEVANQPNSPISAAPVLLVSENLPPEEWYWEAVTAHVDLQPRMASIHDEGCWMLSGEEQWGAVGASAAIAWRPGDTSTWELIAWRNHELIGQPRQITSEAVRMMEEEHPLTFVNRDPTAGRGLIAPRTPCPVLYGIRGATSECVEKAHHWMQTRSDVEQSVRWGVHRTNQLTDDHLGVVTFGTVISCPEEVKGAHSNISVLSGGDRVDLVAFSEGGPVNRLLRTLQIGDRVAWLGLTAQDDAIHLERLTLVDQVPRVTGRPTCCNKSMRSGGAGQQLRCRKCGSTSQREWNSEEADLSGIELLENWSQPSPSNRRHLAMPLELGIPGA
jgi:tRNA(Ile2)-agmatinylcytidine synthase